MQLTGKVFIDVPGFGRLRSKPGATLDIGGNKREAQMWDGGVAGFTETPVQPSIECEVLHDASISLAQLAQIKNVQVSFQTDTGSGWVLQNAWLADPPTLSGGTIKLKFEGLRADEVK